VQGEGARRGGVRDRRLHGAPRLAPSHRRAAGRGLGRRWPALRRQGRHRFHRADAGRAASPPVTAGASHAAVRQPAARARRHLARTPHRRPARFHRNDHRRQAPPPRLPRTEGGQRRCRCSLTPEDITVTRPGRRPNKTGTPQRRRVRAPASPAQSWFGGRQGGPRREACDDRRPGSPRGRSPLAQQNGEAPLGAQTAYFCRTRSRTWRRDSPAPRPDCSTVAIWAASSGSLIMSRNHVE